MITLSWMSPPVPREASDQDILQGSGQGSGLANHPRASPLLFACGKGISVNLGVCVWGNPHGVWKPSHCWTQQTPGATFPDSPTWQTGRSEQLLLRGLSHRREVVPLLLFFFLIFTLS